jgi:hypothetical protein
MTTATLPLLPTELIGLPALTMTAPYGTAIARWGKGWENRPWMPPKAVMGHRIGIHQGRIPVTSTGGLAGDETGRSIRDAYSALHNAGMSPPGYAAGWKQVFDDSRMLLGTSVVADVVQVLDDHAVSRWASPGKKLERDRWMIPGGYAWHLADFEPLAQPVPMKGLQRLWTIRQNLVVTR